MHEQYGFELLSEQRIVEYNTTAKLYRHVKSGAQALSMENADENKVFGITFRTPPPDSTGLPHIMEHSVLCGSKKYPVKEPFVELIKGSLNTFLNAMTFPDKTCYPVASQNLQDLYNLIDVYLDAVLYPRITPEILQQEGWHYELDAPDAPMTFKGVVFNEMKGAYSSPDSLIGRHSQQSLFPDTPYGLDSGGDPDVIPNLTYEQFKEFHATYYHPSNARIYFYGDDDPEERLRRLNEVLKDFDAREVPSEIPLQTYFDQPRRETIPYDAGEEQDAANTVGEADEAAHKGRVTVNWLLPEMSDAEAILGLRILDHALIGTPASPLRKALIDSGLGEDLTGWGIVDQFRQLIFSTGLKGIAPDDAGKVEELVLSTLEALAEDGLDADTVAASLNTIEFRLRENNSGSYPQGLMMMIFALSTWLYDQDPVLPLAFEAPLQSIKDRLAAGERYFETLIRQHFVANNHRTTVLLTPDATVRKAQEAQEADRLEQAKSAMTDADVQQVIDTAEELKRLQETPDSPEALATLPMLTLDDLEKENKTVPTDVIQSNGDTVLYHDLFTNGIVYLDVGFDLHTLPQDLLPYVPLFGACLTKIGTEREDFVKISQRIGQKTGGIWSSRVVTSTKDPAQSLAWLFLQAKSTMAQADDMLALLRDLLLTIKLDNQERFKQMVLETKSRKESGVIPGGHAIVNTRLRAHFDEAGWLNEQMSGVDGLFFTRKLADDVVNNWPAVLEKLEAIRRIFVNRNAMLCNVTLDQDNWRTFQPKLDAFLEQIPALDAAQVTWTPQPPTPFEGLTIPARVNYVAKGARLYDFGYQFHGSEMAILNYVRTTWLWEQVRVRGGAYGGFCSFDRHSGVFTYLSYRDPNLLGTLDNYDQTAQVLKDADINKEELAKSIIGAVGQLDAYQLPDAKGFSAMMRHLLGITDAERQQIRDELLATQPQDFTAFADILQQINEHGLVVVLGSKEAIDEVNAEKNNWLKVAKVL